MKKRNVVIREALLAAGLSLSLLASGCGGQAGTDSGITESTTSSALSQDSEEETVQSGNESETADISSSGSLRLPISPRPAPQPTLNWFI